MIYNCFKPDPAVKTAAQATAHASHMINRTGALLNYGLGKKGHHLHIKSVNKIVYLVNQSN